MSDALAVVEFHDKYEFTVGLQICSHILSEFISKHKNVTLATSNDIFDSLVHASATAHQFRLDKANNLGWDFVKCLMKEATSIMLTVDHVKQLQPLLIEHGSEYIFCGNFDLEKEMIESQLFPMFFCGTG